jgi:hypothetical protein
LALIAPPLPPIAAPVLTNIKPVVPLLEDPDKKDIDPVTPVVPAFGVAKDIAPLDVEIPKPVVNDTLPPVPGRLMPD